MLMTHPTKIKEMWKEEVITGKATTIDEVLMDESSRLKPTVGKIRYLDTILSDSFP